MKRGINYKIVIMALFAFIFSGQQVFAAKVITANDKKPKSVFYEATAGVSGYDATYRRSGFSFGMGMLGPDFTYSWKFISHTSPKWALEGSFKHVLGDTADSYLIMVNETYLFQRLKKSNKKFKPYVTAGMGLINTATQNSIGSDTVSHMAINYGVGIRHAFNKHMSFVFNAVQYTVFESDGVLNSSSFTAGFLVGRLSD